MPVAIGKLQRSAALMLFSCVALLFGAQLADAGRTKHSQFEGNLVRDRNSAVELKLSDHPKDPKELRFQVFDLPELCSDGSSISQTYVPIQLKYRSARRFRGRFIRTASDNGETSRYIVRGRFSQNGRRARGTVFTYWDRGSDQEYPGRPYSCGTDGEERWRAVLVD